MSWKFIETKGQKSLWENKDSKGFVYYAVTRDQGFSQPKPPSGGGGGYYSRTSATKGHEEWKPVSSVATEAAFDSLLKRLKKKDEEIEQLIAENKRMAAVIEKL